MHARLLLLAVPLFVTACASAPTATTVPKCPRIPPLQLEYPERNWQGEMESFLQGTLPTQPSLPKQ